MYFSAAVSASLNYSTHYLTEEHVLREFLPVIPHFNMPDVAEVLAYSETLVRNMEVDEEKKVGTSIAVTRTAVD